MIYLVICIEGRSSSLVLNYRGQSWIRGGGGLVQRSSRNHVSDGMTHRQLCRGGL